MSRTRKQKLHRKRKQTYRHSGGSQQKKKSQVEINIETEIKNVDKAMQTGQALTPLQQEVYNYVENTKGVQQVVPPNLNFLNRSYYNNPRILSSGDSWMTLLKGIVSDPTMTNQQKLTLLQSYKTELAKKSPLSKTLQLNKKKKNIALNNRIQDVSALFAAAQQHALGAGVPSSIGVANTDTHAGVVLRFADGKALYTVSHDGKYGFPKGKIEYYQTPTGPQREKSQDRAIKELREETGFFIDKQLLKREYPTASGLVVDLKYYTISSTSERRETYIIDKSTVNAYYYIIQLKEASTALGPNLSTLTDNAIAENIIRYEIQDQYDPTKTPKQQLRPYNQYSSFRF